MNWSKLRFLNSKCRFAFMLLSISDGVKLSCPACDTQRHRHAEVRKRRKLSCVVPGQRILSGQGDDDCLNHLQSHVHSWRRMPWPMKEQPASIIDMCDDDGVFSFPCNYQSSLTRPRFASIECSVLPRFRTASKRRLLRIQPHSGKSRR
jgi:hypothetical protein